jgi:hypothetical protein
MALNPYGIAVDGNGNVFFDAYVPERFNLDGAAYEILADGGYKTVRTLPGNLEIPFGMAVDGTGNVLVADTQMGIQKFDLADPPSLLFPIPTPVGGEVQTLSAWNSGNEPLVFTTPATGTNPEYPQGFPENTADTDLCAAGTSLAPSTGCDLSVSFDSSNGGVTSGNLVLTDNSLNENPAIQSLSVAATATTVISPTPNVDLGSVPLGKAFGVYLTIKNNLTGGEPITFTVENQGPSTVSIYLYNGYGCSLLAAGQSCDQVLTFRPASVGVHHASIVITPSVGSPFIVKARGIGTAP